MKNWQVWRWVSLLTEEEAKDCEQQMRARHPGQAGRQELSNQVALFLLLRRLQQQEASGGTKWTSAQAAAAWAQEEAKAFGKKLTSTYLRKLRSELARELEDFLAARALLADPAQRLLWVARVANRRNHPELFRRSFEEAWQASEKGAARDQDFHAYRFELLSEYSIHIYKQFPAFWGDMADEAFHHWQKVQLYLLFQFAGMSVARRHLAPFPAHDLLPGISALLEAGLAMPGLEADEGMALHRRLLEASLGTPSDLAALRRDIMRLWPQFSPSTQRALYNWMLNLLNRAVGYPDRAAEIEAWFQWGWDTSIVQIDGVLPRTLLIVELFWYAQSERLDVMAERIRQWEASRIPEVKGEFIQFARRLYQFERGSISGSAELLREAKSIYNDLFHHELLDMERRVVYWKACYELRAGAKELRQEARKMRNWAARTHSLSEERRERMFRRLDLFGELTSARISGKYEALQEALQREPQVPGHDLTWLRRMIQRRQ